MKTPAPIRIPLRATLRKYGFASAEEWLALATRDAQGNIVCAVCGKPPMTGRLVTDHEHVKGWKKLPPSERRRFCRGLTDWFCNNAYLGRGITVEKARGVVAYLEAYAARRPATK